MNSGQMWQSHLAASGSGTEPSAASESELLDAARASDERAFAELCRRHIGPVQRRLFRMLRNREDAEDVMQEAMFKAFTNPQRFRGSSSFASWFTRIAINSALMLMRKRGVRTEVSYDCQPVEDHESQWDFPDRSPTAEQVCIRRQVRERLLIAIDRLPPHYRQLIRHFHCAEQSLQEAADNSGLKINTAKSRLVRARLKLRIDLSRRDLLRTCVSPKRRTQA